MNWLTIGKKLLRIIGVCIESAIEVSESRKKEPAQHSAFFARELYEKGEISYTEFQRALDPD